MRPSGKRSKAQAGMTLAELIIACSLLVLVAGGALTLMLTSVKTFAAAQGSLASQSALRSAMLVLVETTRAEGSLDPARYVVDRADPESPVLRDTLSGMTVAAGIAELHILQEGTAVRLHLVAADGTELETLLRPEVWSP